MMARVEYGTVVWTEDIDIAPEHLYECSEQILTSDASADAAAQV